jgi:hypothetical protein
MIMYATFGVFYLLYVFVIKYSKIVCMTFLYRNNVQKWIWLSLLQRSTQKDPK